MATEQQLRDLAYALEKQFQENNKDISFKSIRPEQMDSLLVALKDGRIPNRNMSAHKKIVMTMDMFAAIKLDNRITIVRKEDVEIIQYELKRLKEVIPEIGNQVEIVKDESEAKEFPYDPNIQYPLYQNPTNIATMYYEYFPFRCIAKGPDYLIGDLIENHAAPNSFLPIKFAAEFGVPLYDVGNRYNAFMKQDPFGERDLVNAVHELHLTNPDGLKHLNLLLNSAFKARKIVYLFDVWYRDGRTKAEKVSVDELPATQPYDAPDVIERERSPKRVVEGNDSSPKRTKIESYNIE